MHPSSGPAASGLPSSGPPSSGPTSSGPPASRDQRPAGPSARPRTTRRAELLREAARLFAERGFHGVSIEQIGAAVGIRGPGIYRHVASKQALLVELLTNVSEELLAGGHAELAAATGPADALDRLVRRHVTFALDSPDLIVVHDRDLASLPPEANRTVRRLQRTYVELWADVLRELHPASGARPALDETEARARAHALFGLINSTPRSAVGADRDRMAETLRRMAVAAAVAG